MKLSNGRYWQSVRNFDTENLAHSTLNNFQNSKFYITVYSVWMLSTMASFPSAFFTLFLRKQNVHEIEMRKPSKRKITLESYKRNDKIEILSNGNCI